MKIKYLALSILFASIGAQAATVNNTVYGKAQGQLSWKDSKDFQTQAQFIAVGSKGSYKTDDFKIIYEAEVQYSDNFAKRGLDDFELNTARIIIASKLGAVVAGHGYSGIYSDVYKRVDIHQSNNAEIFSGNKMLWEQAAYAKNILAYATPSLAVGQGKLKLVGSIVTPKEDNGSNDDVVTARLVYNSANFNAAIGFAQVDKKFPANEADDNYKRYSIGADYEFSGLTIAGLIEVNEDSFNKSKNTYVGAIKYQYSLVDFGVSYQLKTYEDTTDNCDQSLLIASINYNYDEHLSFFVEGSFYGEEPVLFKDNYSADAINLGIKLKI